jgi:hypothetical protein
MVSNPTTSCPRTARCATRHWWCLSITSAIDARIQLRSTRVIRRPGCSCPSSILRETESFCSRSSTGFRRDEASGASSRRGSVALRCATVATSQTASRTEAPPARSAGVANLSQRAKGNAPHGRAGFFCGCARGPRGGSGGRMQRRLARANGDRTPTRARARQTW